MKIIVATHNGGKLAEIRRILEERLGADAADIELVSAGSLGLPDPVEDGVTFQENALIKARDVAERTGCPAVADDSGLIVDVMGNAPGILSARWAGEHGNDKANNALLLKHLPVSEKQTCTTDFRGAALTGSASRAAGVSCPSLDAPPKPLIVKRISFPPSIIFFGLLRGLYNAMCPINRTNSSKIHDNTKKGRAKERRQAA